MRKLVPFHANEIDKTVQWLNDLAGEGLCVETWGSFFVKLKEGESADWIYQIDIDDSTGDPNYQRKLELEKQDWQYVQTIGTTRHHIYRTRNQSARLVWNGEYIEKYRKKQRVDLFWGVVAAIVCVIIYLWLAVFRNWNYLILSLVESRWDLAVITVLVLYTMFVWVLETAGTVRLERRLAEGNRLAERRGDNYQRDMRMRPKVLNGLGKILMIITTLGWSVLSLGLEDEGHNFDDSQPVLPCVDLRNLEAEGFEITEITWVDNPDVNFGNRILEKTGLLTEYFCEVHQYGTDVAGEDVQISGQYYKLRPDSITDAVLEQLIDRSTSYMYEHQWIEEDKRLPEDYWTITESEHAAFESVVVADAANGDGPLMIFARVEDVIIYLRYYGNLPAGSFVEELTRLYP